MELNADQHMIFKELNDFVFNENNTNKFYLLTGLAGTGKTYLITYLLSLPELSRKKIAVTGCTNKAVGVLQSTFFKIQKLKNQPTQSTQSNKENQEKDMNSYYNLNFLTIHKLLQIKRKINANGEEVFESMIDENNVKIKSKSIFHYNLIIIDEVSMLNRDITLQLLRLQNKIKGKIIFLGDKAQLPPVRESESHIFELSETKLPNGNLKKIMRSGDQIVNFANSIRQLIDNPQHKVPFKKLASPIDGVSRIGLYRNQEEWINKYLKENMNTDQIILCYTNKRVDYLNHIIRNTLYHTNTNNFVNGEKIIFNNTYSLPININKYDSSQMVRIGSSSLSSINIRQFNLYDILNIRFPVSSLDQNCSSEFRKKCKIPELSTESTRIEKSNIKMDESKCMVCYDDIKDDIIEYAKCSHHFCDKCFDTFKNQKKENEITECPICMFKIKDGNIIVSDDNKLSDLLNELRDISKNNNSKYKTWLIMLENNDLLNVIHHDEMERYNNTLERIKTQLRNINTYIQTKYPNNDNLVQKVLIQLWEFYYYYYIDQFADINYGNAITTHRSQGSTYQRVYVDLIDIITCNNVKKESYQCLYTAVTRASDYLEILY
jgi:hypothetical protein